MVNFQPPEAERSVKTRRCAKKHSPCQKHHSAADQTFLPAFTWGRHSCLPFSFRLRLAAGSTRAHGGLPACLYPARSVIEGRVA